MITKKILLSIVTITLLYAGCNEENNSTSQEKVQTIKTKEEPSKIVEIPVKKEESAIPIAKTVQKVVSTPTAVTLFQKCASCHGQNAEKKALNQSAIIKDWDATKIANALKGYKAGTYGGSMKGLMKAQVNNLSNKEIELLSEYIAKQ